jgi:hypothetical protein
MANTEKVYVGRTTEATNKFGELETRIGFTADDIQKLTDNLNEKGWVNVTLRKSKEGKPYLQVYTPAPATAEEKLPF